eukprot:4101159-Prymnesium_polylepis.1
MAAREIQLSAGPPTLWPDAFPIPGPAKRHRASPSVSPLRPAPGSRLKVKRIVASMLQEGRHEAEDDGERHI